MDQHTYQVNPGFVWPIVGHPGQVPLWALVANPNQPRKEAGFSDEDLDSLASTMKAENDGELREILTVRLLTDEEQGHYPSHVRYMIISGDRRWLAAARAGLSFIEIRVKRYKSTAYEELDMYMLNEGRVGLSDIENADYLARLMVSFNLKTQDELAQKVAKNPVEVSQLLSLLKLSPKVRAKMSPLLSKHVRFVRGVGVYLAHLTHEVQDDFAERMPQGPRVTGGQQIRWMEEQLKSMPSVELPTNQARPSTLRRIFGYYADQVERRAKELREKPNVGALFENASQDQKFALYGRLKDAQAEFAELVAQVEALIPELNVSNEKDKVKAPPHEDPPLVEAKPAPVVLDEDMPKPSPPVLQPEPSMVLSKSSPPLDYFDKASGQMRIGEQVNWAKYLSLHASQDLDFQIRGRTRPSDLPDPKMVREQLAQFRKEPRA